MRRAGALSILALVLAGRPARADDARPVAARVLAEWRKAGAEGAALPSRFLFEDETVIVPLADADDRPCTTVAIVGARGLGFRARFSDASNDPLTPEPGARASSAAGIAELRRCRSGGGPARHLVITTEAGRGTLEIVVGHSDRALPPLAALLPERTGGVLPPVPEAGALPALTPPERRADGAEARARRDGAVVGPRAPVFASEDGGGEDDLELEAGCHRVELFGRDVVADRPGRRFRLDVDAELKDGDRVLARDRTEAPDARLETCIGAPTRLTLAFAGAPPRSDLLLTRAWWPLPPTLPDLWGPATRARLARLFFVRHVAAPVEAPVLLAQGSTGPTPIPVSVEPGACYVAVVATTRSRPRQLQLRVLTGARESVDERGAVDEAALAGFCAGEETRARVEVLARGTGVSWGLAVYRMRSGVWEAGR